MSGFDPAGFAKFVSRHGHNGLLRLRYRDHGPDWVELGLPFRPDLAGAEGGFGLAAVASLMDMTGAMAIWTRRGGFAPQATADLRIDRLREPRPGADLVGRCDCTRLGARMAFVRGLAYDGDVADPVAQAVGTFMLMEPA